MSKEIHLSERAKLVENIIFLDGHTRAGKMFLANLIEGFENVEKFLYFSIPEQISQLNMLGFIEKETAKAIIGSQIDNFVYNRVIGRNLNFRFSDKSSITNSPKADSYMKRLFEEDGDSAVQKIKKSEKIFPFVLHEAMSNIKLFFDIYPKLKVIKIKRNPVDLTYSWFKRGYGKRWGKDPKVFSIPIKGKNGPVPWFAYQWTDKYAKMSEMDRIITSMQTLNKMSIKSLKKLPDNYSKRIHFLTYELLSTKPEPELEKISNFLKRKITPEMKLLMAKERFIPHPKTERKEKIDVIKKNSSKECYSAILELGKQYEEKWEKN